MLQAYRRDVDREVNEVQRVRQLGQELLDGRENVRGAAGVRSQIENIKLRWEIILKTANNRQQLLDTVLERSFRDSHKNIVAWITRRCEDVKILDSPNAQIDKQKHIQVTFASVSHSYFGHPTHVDSVL